MSSVSGGDGGRCVCSGRKEGMENPMKRDLFFSSCVWDRQIQLLDKWNV